MMALKKMGLTAAVAAVMALAGGVMTAGTANAATCKFGTLDDFTAEADVYTSTACIGQNAGNDSTAVFNAGNFFGSSNWSQNTKIDVDEDESTDPSTFSFEAADPSGILSATLGLNALSGTWSVTGWNGVEKAALVLKGGNGYAAYLLDLTAGTSGGWVTQALENNGGNQPALSHASLYTTPAAPIPLPAGAILLITALGGLGIATRRRRNKAA